MELFSARNQMTEGLVIDCTHCVANRRGLKEILKPSNLCICCILTYKVTLTASYLLSKGSP
jgi:hypothetical protein